MDAETDPIIGLTVGNIALVSAHNESYGDGAVVVVSSLVERSSKWERKTWTVLRYNLH